MARGMFNAGPPLPAVRGLLIAWVLGAGGDAQCQEVKSTVRSFYAAGDRQDTAALEPLLHAGFRVVLAKPGEDGVSTMPRALYLDLLRAKKIGGVKRAVQIHGCNVNGTMAQVMTNTVSKTSNMSAFLTLARKDGRWSVVQDAVLFRGG